MLFRKVGGKPKKTVRNELKTEAQVYFTSIDQLATLFFRRTVDRILIL